MSTENIINPTPENESPPPIQPNITEEGVDNQIRRDAIAGGFGEIEDYENSLPEGVTPRSLALSNLIGDSPTA